MLTDMLLDNCLQRLTFDCVQRTRCFQQIAEGARLVGDPGMHARNQLILFDEVQLQCKDAEEKIPIRGHVDPNGYDG